jgi:hypothetical protein
MAMIAMRPRPKESNNDDPSFDGATATGPNPVTALPGSVEILPRVTCIERSGSIARTAKATIRTIPTRRIGKPRKPTTAGLVREEE